MQIFVPNLMISLIKNETNKSRLNSEFRAAHLTHSPLDGVLSVLGVLAVRVEEDVLIDAPTQAEHIRCRVLT